MGKPIRQNLAARVPQRALAVYENLAFRQLLRFALAGGGVAVISVLVYWAAAVLVRINPIVSNFLSYLANVLLGFLIHKIWTFRELTKQGKNERAPFRYILVSLFALAMNTGWTALLTAVLKQAVWTPIIPMVMATPLITFFINRIWVFESSRGG